MGVWLAGSVLLVVSGPSAPAVAAAPVAAASAAGSGPIAIPACQQAGPCVVVQVLDGTRQVDEDFYYADTISGGADVTRASYPVKGGNDAVVAKGSSVARLVGLSVADPAKDVTYVEVVWNDAYQRHLLSGPEAVSGTGFQGGLRPVFYSPDPDPDHPTQLSYVRPQRGPDDDNGAPGPDQGVANGDPQGAFLVRVHTTGEVLHPVVTATATDATRRSWSLATDQSGAGDTYDWVLPDGSRSTAATPSFTYPADALAGSYPATVGVGTTDGSFGWGSTLVPAGDPPSQAPSPSASGPGGRQRCSTANRSNYFLI